MKKREQIYPGYPPRCLPSAGRLPFSLRENVGVKENWKKPELLPYFKNELASFTKIPLIPDNPRNRFLSFEL